MAEPQEKGSSKEAQPAPGGAAPADIVEPTWRELWQMPAIVVGVLSLVGAGILAIATRPQVDHQAMLDSGERLLEDGKPLEAIEELNTRVFPYEARGELSSSARARYYLLLARAMYVGQRRMEIRNSENDARILEAFAEAERAGATLTDRDIFSVGETHLAMGNLDAALTWAGRLSDAGAGRRRELLKRAVEGELARGRRDSRAMELLASLLEDPGLGVEDRAWVAKRQAEALLRDGFADEAIARLLREIQRLEGLAPDRLADLHVVLAGAYVDRGAHGEASAQLDLASGLLNPSDSMMGEVEWMRGIVHEARGESEAARESLLRVLSEYPSSAAVLPATLELAEIEARLDLTEESLTHYERVRDLVREGRRHARASRERVLESLLARSQEALERERFEHGVRLARLAESLHAGEETPALVLLALGMSERALGLALIEAAEEGVGRVRSVADMDPATREEARRHLIAAGSTLLRHARARVVDDYEAFGESLFLAGDSLDRAGDQQEAIGVWREFIDAFPDDPRRAEARYRLAKAFEARGEGMLAVDLYRGLIADRNDPQVKSVGIYGDLSYVPLAALLARDGDPGNDAEAEGLLRSVVRGEVVREPDTELYRDGLFELGSFLALSGREGEAIGVLSEAIERFGDDPRALDARYRLAGVLRREASRIAEELTRAIPPGERERLSATRVEHLRTAEGLYERTASDLEAMDPRRVSPAQAVVLRNSVFYRALCAHELGDLERAIGLYDAAYARFAQEAASLVALTRIVDIRLAQGDMRGAMVANERARRFFASLPDSVWEDPMLPMSRADWESWLSSTAALARVQEEGP